MGVHFLQPTTALAVGRDVSAISGTKAGVLTSWKEIAVYMNAGVRTVQRYERSFGLPVRRLAGKSRSSVRAYPIEIDAWLGEKAHKAVEPTPCQEDDPRMRLEALLANFRAEVAKIHTLLAENKRLRKKTLSLQPQFLKLNSSLCSMAGMRDSRTN